MNRRFAQARERLSKESLTKVGFWEDIMPRINQGVVIPIISNSFRIEQIFREEKQASDPSGAVQPADGQDLTVEEQLTEEWANFIEYPLPDVHNLARVTQYFLIEQKDNLAARAKYLEFLKTFLLTIAEEDEGYRDVASRLINQVQEQHFSEIVRQLDYPRFPEGTEDPLRLLARLPLPLYITTSYYDFLERALEAEGKKPITQVCFWSGTKVSPRTESLQRPDKKPAADEPEKPIVYVYHLYGIEDYPQTMVLSEDDFMNFLFAMAQDNDTQNPILPLEIRGKLAEQTLLLLGYQLRDWDFRVLFRFIAKFRKEELSPPRGMVIQLKKSARQTGNLEKSLQYLSRYFDKKQFDIEWSEAESFVQQLSEKWNEYRRSQS
jgi:hypothetical protein